jgi:hypothetical protein
MITVMAVNLGLGSFHFSTLEEYYTGGLFLGPFNPISDGSLVIYLLFIFMGIFGNSFWTYTIFEGNSPSESLRLIDLSLIGASLSQVVIYLMCLKNVILHQKKELKEGDPNGEPLVLSHLIIQIVGYFLPMIIIGSLLVIGIHPIISTPSIPGQLNPVFCLILVQAFLMQHLTFILQVCHVTKSKYSPFKSKLMLFELLAVPIIYAVDK